MIGFSVICMHRSFSWGTAVLLASRTVLPFLWWLVYGKMKRILALIKELEFFKEKHDLVRISRYSKVAIVCAILTFLRPLARIIWYVVFPDTSTEAFSGFFFCL
ncbi:hypothetical protein CEXT_432931 [Caerostris extrusa]|uniref:Uncharacterized protein n=1 Tax=Caerostris extrusa TaxID=172846 RepID=A0AAV4RRK5_CAEEX|nr:hypothetical protein CEXT_432931 [Caerostris extrusa]